MNRARVILWSELAAAASLPVLVIAAATRGWLGDRFSSHAGTLAAILFLYLPFLAARLHSKDVFDWSVRWAGARRELAWAGLACAATFPPFVVGYHLWFSGLADAGTDGLLSRLLLSFNASFALTALIQIVGVALPEEAYYRGYLEARAREAGLGAWQAAAFTAGVFALGHFVIIPNPARLAVFFPALGFSFLRARTGGLGACTLFHAAANVLVTLLDRAYFGAGPH